MQKQTLKSPKRKTSTSRATRAKTTARPKGIVHHTKRIAKLTPMFVHGMVAGAFVGIMVLVTFGNSGSVSALTIKSPRDCDSNAIISCGALSTTELRQRYYNKNIKGVAAIYNYFGISASDVNNMGSTAVAGRVYKDGRVTVGSKVVATDARTVGRENITGSSRVRVGGVTFYTRKPSVSFHPKYINAFVVMKDGQFDFAILGACANAVSARAIPKATPPPEVPEELPPPPATVTPPSTQTPPSTPAPEVHTAAVSKPATELPKTGPGAIVMVVSLAIIGGYLFHTTHRHVKRRRHAHHNLHG